MSECVVRMDHIPRNCLECPLNGQCGIFADWVCTLNSPARKHYPQPFDKGCNILAVLSEPHGRLVDADELIAILRKKSKEFSDSMYGEGVKCGLADARDHIAKAQTIVPAEMRVNDGTD